MENNIRLKVPAPSKQKAWIEELAMFVGNNLSIYSKDTIRTKVREGLINLDLYNGKIHVEDFLNLLNPMDLSTIDTSREIQHYATAAPIIDLLVGEEINLPFEPGIYITNNIGIEGKKERMRQYVEQRIEKISQELQDPEEIRAAVQALYHKLKYTYKDVKEVKASAIYADYAEKINFKEIFVEGFRRVFNLGEEAYEIDVQGKEPVFRVINTLNLRVYGGNKSSRIEDADVIVEERHLSPGAIIDLHGDELTDTQVENILNYQIGQVGARFDKPYGDVTHEYSAVGEILGRELYSNLVDNSGGIRYLKTRVKAYKKIKKIKYFDEVLGVDQIKVRSYNYTLAPGEVLDSTEWIVEWWVFSLIGSDIVVGAKPNPIRFNRLSNFTEGHPGIVGEIYNINEQNSVPIMSRMRPFQYWYDIVIDNMLTAMSKNIGPILEMDLAKRPEKWDTKKWLHYITKYNVKFVDSFKEVNKGPAQGQLAGNLASGRDQTTSIDFGNYIQQLVSVAEYLERSMAGIVGITPQRLGAISNRETYGGIERATAQSSHITAWYSYKHEQVKIRALNVFMEAAKQALKDNPKKLQTLIDSTTREILEITEDDFVDVDLGVYLSNSKKVHENNQLFQQMAQAYMQNGGDFSFVYKILFSESMADRRRLIEADQEDRMQQAQQDRKQALEIENAKAEKEAATEQAKLELEKYKADLEASIKLKMKEMDLAIEEGKMQASREKTLDELKADMEMLELEMKQRDAEMKSKEKIATKTKNTATKQ